MGPRGLVPLRGVGQHPTSSWRKQEAGLAVVSTWIGAWREEEPALTPAQPSERPSRLVPDSIGRRRAAAGQRRW